MASGISNQELLNKCKRYILADPNTESLDDLIKDAIISAEREMATLDMVPLAWMRYQYDTERTKYAAIASEITQADPCIVTADSEDPDVTGHGFVTGDILLAYGTSVHELNTRKFIAEKIDDDTFYLRDINNLDRLDTSDYTDPGDGWTFYLAGITLPAASIEPGTAWHINDISSVTFDGYASEPVSEDVLHYRQPAPISGRPSWWKYERFGYQSQANADVTHRLYFQPTGQRYNINIEIIKAFDDIDTWDTDAYPPHPPDTHDYIWHKALANLATVAERQRRSFAKAGDIIGDNTRIEVLFAEIWSMRAAEDEVKIVELNRRLLGQRAGGFSTGIRG